MGRQVRQSILDRAIGYFSPQMALDRSIARAKRDLLLRQYDVATHSESTAGWRRPSSSARGETTAGLVRGRNAMRDMVRNNPYFRKITGDLTDLSIGTGIVPRANTGDKVLDKRLNGFWSRHIRTMDVEGIHNAYGLQRIAAHGFWESGEVLSRRRFRRPEDGLEIPVQQQLIEGDFVDHTQSRRLDSGGMVVQGVEYDRLGRRRVYHMFGEHPGDPLFGGSTGTRPVPASEIRHMFEALRPGQVRGMPPFTASMITARRLATTDEAKDLQQRLAACLTLIVSGSEVGLDGHPKERMGNLVRDAHGNVVEQLEPALIAYMRSGSDVKAFQPPVVSDYVEYRRSRLHALGAGARVTYSIVTGDYSQENYSSYRAGMNLVGRMVEAIVWLIMIPMMFDPWWGDMVEGAILAGLVPVDTPVDVIWSAPPMPTVDPLKDAMADLIETRAGFRSLQDAIAKRGYDPDEVITEIKAATELLDRLELVLDSDPRRVSKTGIQQGGLGGGDRSADTDGMAAAIRQLTTDPDMRARLSALLH